jgi:hypothetical protein
MKFSACVLLTLKFVVDVVKTDEHHHHHHANKPLYFVPSLKDAAHLADLLFAQAHFT